MYAHDVVIGERVMMVTGSIMLRSYLWNSFLLWVLFIKVNFIHLIKIH